jgi:HD superfamily phosphodiesterase
MIPTKEQIKEVHKRYAQNDFVFNLVFGHCKIVSEIAKWCVENKNLTVDKNLLEAGCLLHDIGTYALFDEKVLMVMNTTISNMLFLVLHLLLKKDSIVESQT